MTRGERIRNAERHTKQVLGFKRAEVYDLTAKRAAELECGQKYRAGEVTHIDRQERFCVVGGRSDGDSSHG